MNKIEWHVYADDGYESTHRSERAAIAAAKRWARRRCVAYRVVMTSRYGYTGGGHGTTVCQVGATGEVES